MAAPPDPISFAEYRSAWHAAQGAMSPAAFMEALSGCVASLDATAQASGATIFGMSIHSIAAALPTVPSPLSPVAVAAALIHLNDQLRLLLKYSCVGIDVMECACGFRNLVGEGRGLICLESKVDHFKRALLATETPTPQPMDEYENPRELCTVVVNRKE